MLVHLLLAASSLQQGRADRPSPFASAKLPTAGVFGHERNGPLRESPILFTSDIPNNEMELSQRSSPINWDQIHISIAWICIGLYCFVWFICSIGYTEMRRRYAKPLPAASPSHSKENLPFVSILRPIKGLDPHLALTLNSTFHIDYPANLHEIVFCVASALDPSIPVIRSLCARYPEITSKLLIWEEDVGANPKIRTLSKAYREANGDIVWVIDSNIWLPSGILERSVKELCGLDETGKKTRKGYKLLHHLPIAIDTEEEDVPGVPRITKSSANSTPKSFMDRIRKFRNTFGGPLEETFLSTSHAKFYTAINTLALAPCALGKSTMWRRSHLASITPPETSGIIHFAPNICEDHMLGAHIYNVPLPSESPELGEDREIWGRHIMGQDLVYQPMVNMSIKDYTDRRTRWLRVRKFAVLSATLLEPETESVLCNALGSYGFITVLENYELISYSATLGQFGYMVLFWSLGMALWSYLDYLNFKILHSFATIDRSQAALPKFISSSKAKKWATPLGWASQWLGREFLALPLWIMSILSDEINWRGGRYVVLWDMTARAVGVAGKDSNKIALVPSRSRSRSKGHRLRRSRGHNRTGSAGSPVGSMHHHKRRGSLKL